MNDEIKKLIEDAIEKGTFSLNAVKAIKEMKDQVEDLLDTTNQLREQLTTSNDKYQTITKDRDNLYKLYNDIKTREGAILNKELELAALKATADKHQAVSAAVTDIVRLVFRSPVYSASVVGYENNQSFNKTISESVL